MEISSSILSDITHHMKYAKYIPELQRRESWDDTVTRNMEMHIKKFPELEEEIRAAYRFVYDRKVLPSMRSMQFAGKPIEVNNARLFNCFSRDTTFVTSEGVRSFEDFNDGDSVTVLTHTGNWRRGVVRNYGRQKLNKITIVRGRNTQTVRATPNHRWILRDGSETTDLRVGDKLMSAPAVFDGFDYDTAPPLERLYWAYGYVFGDGTLVCNQGIPTHSMVRLCGHNNKFLSRFEELGFGSSSPTSLNGDSVVYTGKYLKEVPDPTVDPPELIRAFVAGYLDADGGRDNSPTTLTKFKSILATGEQHQYVVEKLFPVAGVFISSSRDYTGKETNLGVRGNCRAYSLSTNLTNKTNMSFVVKEISEDHEEDVWCLEVEEDHSFVLATGVVTGNCSFLPMNDLAAFSELMFLLLSGCGVGYSVQRHHVEQLPEIRKPVKSRRFLVADSIEGWADAVKQLMKAYLAGKPLPVFDFSDIRPKGAALITSGGKAPGPEPLRECLRKIAFILNRKQDGDKLSPIEVHDINCIIADAVLAGGIRRSAMIALFNLDDEEMLTAKSNIPVEILEEPVFNDNTVNVNVYYHGRHHVTITQAEFETLRDTGKLPWYYLVPERARANNTAVILRHKVKKKDFLKLWKVIQESGSGEPGFMMSNDREWGLNPCAEISLRANQFCNLTSVNVSDIESQEEYEARARAAAFIGTLQASYTDFHYLREVWKKTTEKEALIGVSMTGIASGKVLNLDMAAAAEVVKAENERVAKLIGINPAARCTTVKPEGTSSLILGSSSGIHAWHNDYYMRRVRVGKNEPIYTYLSIFHPELLEDEAFRPETQAVICVPIKAPNGAVTRSESALDLLNRVSRVWNEWVSPGHRKGENINNVSTTVSIKDHEWEDVGEWMWKHREEYTALSVLPYDNGTYIQAPFTDISKKEYETKIKHLTAVDLSQVVELQDGTDLMNELACAGGACEVV